MKARDLYIDRVLGLQKLPSSIYYDIAMDALRYPNKDVQSWEHFGDYVKHCYRCWGVPAGITTGRLEYYKETLAKRKQWHGVVLYLADNKIHILEGHHRLGLYLAENEDAEMPRSPTIPRQPWVVTLENPRNLEELEACAKKIYGFEKLYHKIPGYFHGWQCERPRDSRNLIIERECGPSDIRFLDLGCDTGWFDFEMYSPKRFFVGVDNNPHAIETANRLSFIFDKPVYFIQSDILDFLRDRKKYGYASHFDVTLFLSVFHHIYRKDPSRAAEILNLISTISKSMFFDSVESTDNTSNAFPPSLKEKLTTEFLKDFVLKNTSFIDYELLERDGFLQRHLFHFWG